MSNIVAIVGRPNVGKSTFFNRLTEARDAIVDETAGVTRDRNYGKCEWNGMEFSLIDTGGYITNSEDVFEEEIRKQVMLAIEEADVILFLVDTRNGATDLDDNVAQILRKSGKKVFLVANKVDTNDLIYSAQEFYRYGLGEVYCISGMNGSGTGDLLDDVVKSFTKPSEILEEENPLPKFAIVGRPNVGKSSFLNALLGEDKNIVTPIAGTTRDALHTRYQKFGHDFYLIDTAGIRKKGKVNEDIEFYSVMRSIRAIEYADVCLLLIDATLGIEGQDVNIFNLAQRNRKGIVILVNKWDVVEKDTMATERFSKAIRSRIEPFDDVPIVFVSALTKQRVFKAIEEAMHVYQNRIKRISTSELNEKMLEQIEACPPPSVKGKFVKFKYATQLPTHAPSFVFFCNLPQYVKDSYKRFIENRLREQFDFSGVPIQIFIRKK